ncbi:PKD domain-containing protein [Halorubrum halodurans]|uniref:PKD domain-containing protein n=1 Tax=Halorubrum halodurans TaxID=1383851 RepID=A0A256IJI3_9EURY|nr:PKD domain-containing protein [Halorubrum halodurans]OYR56613.1 hypothetical protein DJ70_08250 [Halorubrum halodurans]
MTERDSKVAARAVFLSLLMLVSMVGAGFTAGGAVEPVSANDGATDPAQSAVEECRTIDEGGTYQLAVDNISATGGTCISITASGVTFDGNDNEIRDGTYSATAVSVSADDVVVKDLRTREVGTAVDFAGVSDGRIENVVVETLPGAGRGVPSTGGTAIVVSGGGNNEIRDNGLYNPGDGPRDDGIVIQDSSSNLVVDNTVSSPTGSGIALSNADDNNVTRNEISGAALGNRNSDVGIQIGEFDGDASNDNRIFDNDLLGNGFGGVSDLPELSNGIVVWTGTGNELGTNLVRGAADEAVTVRDDDTTVVDNTLTASGGNGILVGDVSNANVTDNTVRDAGIADDGSAAGVRDQGTETMIVENRIESGDGRGLYVTSDASTPTVENNSILFNDGYAIDVETSVQAIRTDLGSGASWVTVYGTGYAIDDGRKPSTLPEERQDIGIYLDVDDADGIGEIRMKYRDDADAVSTVDESTLRLWQYDGSWAQPGDSSVDTDADVVSGGTTSAGGTVAPLANNTLPTADATISSTSLAPNEAVTFDASGSTDTDGEIVEYRWDVDGDDSPERNTTSPTYTHAYAQTGDFDPTVTVVDDGDDTDETTLSVNVSEQPIAKLAVSPTPTSIDANTTLNASNSTFAYGTIDEYRWDFDGDGVVDETTASATTNHTYPTTGDVSPTVIVVGDDDTNGTASESLSVQENLPPTGEANSGLSFTCNRGFGRTCENWVGDTVPFIAQNFEDPDGEIVEYQWDFDGDGSIEETTSDPRPSYTYTETGVYTATVTLVDDDGGTLSATNDVSISERKTGNITGAVTNASGDPVANATVIVYREDVKHGGTTTDSSGTYELTDVAADDSTYNVTVDPAGYEADFQELSVEENATETADFQLDSTDADPGSGNVLLTVEDNEGSAIADATVEVRNRSGVVTTETTDGNGQTSYISLPATHHSITVEKNGYETTTAVAAISEGETSFVDAVPETEPVPFFDVRIDSTNEPVTEGETLSVTATINNTGERSDTQSIGLSVGNTQRDSTTVSLESGETETVSLEWPTDIGDASPYAAIVSSENDSVPTSVVVDERDVPANLSGLDIATQGSTATVEETAAVPIDVTVENIGTVPSSYTPTLAITDSSGIVDQRRATTSTLGPGENETVSFSLEAPSAGDYTVEIATDSNATAGSLDVTSVGDTAPVLNDASAVARDDLRSVVRDDDVVEVSVNVSDPQDSPITSVTTDASGFGAGTVSLSETNVEGVYAGIFTVNASKTRDSSEYLRVTATNDAGETNSTRTEFPLGLDTQPPTARVTANRTAITPGETVRFNASGSTDDNFRGPSRHRWDFDSDGTDEARKAFINTETATYTFASAGTYTVELTVSDSAGNTNTTSITVDVGGANQPPTAVNDTYTTPENETLRITEPGVLGNDSDPNNDVLNATLASGPADGTLSLDANGSFEYTPKQGFTGTDSFTYNATDGTLNDTATVTITVTEGGDGGPSVISSLIENNETTFTETRYIEQISFTTDTGVQGLINVTERDPPNQNASTLETIQTEFVDANDSVTGFTSVISIDVRSAPSLDGSETATLRGSVPAAAIEDPAALTVVRVPDDQSSAEGLPTDVIDTSGGTISFAATTTNFSTFVVGEAATSTDDGPAPAVNMTASSVSPNSVTSGEQTTFDVTVRIDNTSLNDDAGEVDVRFEDFDLTGDETDLTIEYTADNVTGGTLTVSENVSATAPATTGVRNVTVTDLRRESSGDETEYLIEDANVTIDTIDVTDAPEDGGPSEVAIEFVPDGGTSSFARDGSRVYAEKIAVAVSGSGSDGVTIGDANSRAFRVVQTDTDQNESVVIEPEPGVGTYNVTGVAFEVYQPNGTIGYTDPLADRGPTLRVRLANGSNATIPATVSGNRGLFDPYRLGSSVFDPYAVQLLDENTTQPSDTSILAGTESRIRGIGYDGGPGTADGLRQNSTEGTIAVSIDRESDVNSSWDVEYVVATSPDSVILNRSVDNSDAASNFTATFDAGGIQNGSYLHGFLVRPTEGSDEQFITLIDETLRIGDSAGGPDDGEDGSQEVDIDPGDLAGTGTQDDPYEISNASELQAMEDDLSANYTLVSDINASETSAWDDGSGFDPVGGNPYNESTPSPFTGSLDGDNHTISGLAINRSSRSYIGLFAGSEGTITDVSLTNVDVTGYDVVGGFVGFNRGEIKNVTVAGEITGSVEVGGLAGYSSDGVVTNATAAGTVSGTNDVGGLVGESWETIENVNVSMTVAGTDDVGGLAGSASGGTIKRAAWSGSVNGTDGVGGLAGHSDIRLENVVSIGTVNGSTRVGGLVGRYYGESENSTIEHATATGAVTGSESVGGLVGVTDQDPTVMNATASGSVDGTDTVGGLIGENDGEVAIAAASGTVNGSTNVGGLVGENHGPIENASATGVVSGSEAVGGLIGDSGPNTITDTFATGSVTGDSDVGGLIGAYSDVYGNQVDDSYWDEQATGQATSASNATGLTTAQMSGEAAESNMTALEFGTVWQTRPNEYPELITQREPDQQPDGSEPAPAIIAPSDGTYDPTEPLTIGTGHNATGVIDDGDVAIRLVNVTDGNATPVALNGSDAVPVEGNVNTTIPAGTLSGNATIETQLYDNSTQTVEATDRIDLTADDGDDDADGVPPVVSEPIGSNGEANFSGTGTDFIRGIAFDTRTDLGGRPVNVTERGTPSESISETIRTRFVDANDDVADFTPAASIGVRGAPSLGEGETATIRGSVSASAVDDPTSLTVVRVPDDQSSAERLPTEVTDTSGDTISFAATTTNFSTFVVGEETSTANVTGTLTAESGASLENDSVFVYRQIADGDIESYNGTVNADGNFSVAVNSTDATYTLAFGDTGSAEPNGVPDLYAIEEVTPSEDVGEVTIPEAHNVTVRVIDNSGDPIEDATVAVGHENGNAAIEDGERNATNENGYLTGQNEAPLELVGEVAVYAEHRGVNDTTNVTVNGDKEVTVELNRPEVTGTLTAESEASLENDSVAVYRQTADDDLERYNGTVDANGNFSVAVDSAEDTYAVGFGDTNDSVTSNGVPDLYAIAEVVPPADVGEVTVPEAYDVTVRVVDENGDPIENADVAVGHRNGDAAIEDGRRNVTNASGYLTGDGEAPLELVGDVSVVAKDDGVTNETRLAVTEEETVELTLNRTDGGDGGDGGTGSGGGDDTGTGSEADPAVDVAQSSVTPTNATTNESKQYTVAVTVENASTAESGEIVVRFAAFDLDVDDDSQDGPEEDLTIEYTESDVTDDTIAVTTTVSGTAPTAAGQYSVAVTDVTNGTGAFLIEDASTEIATIDVADGEQDGGGIDDGTDGGTDDGSGDGITDDGSGDDTTDDSTPGFGPLVTLIALLGAVAILARREDG